MKRKICVHGHFYQPPREDPWFGKIFMEASAAPKRHWNERITRESYAPLAWSRRLDGEGRIADLMNCYEWMSFNIGPTLMLWLEREAPEVLERILEADRLSLARWGHGNAIAQVFHHIILPLASDLDKEVEVAWALADFETRFKRKSEGIWLSECAADLATLEAVAKQGVKFVVLSPRQAKSVSVSGGAFVNVDVHNLDVGRPYYIDLPSGGRVAAFFYEADLAQSVAFEGLLSDGEKFWRKLSSSAMRLQGDNAMLTLATDGETYGHHFTFGEMALAYVLAQGYSGRDGLELTNFGAYLEAFPPTAKVVLHEPSSWSCFHGVERWRGNCGCTTGGHPCWNQEWRAPLRNALDFMKNTVDKHYFALGGKIFKAPRAALLDFGQVLLNVESSADFMAKHLKDGADKVAAWQLLRMQESALAAYASCAWFFDEVSRIEPVNAMRFALRALEIMKNTGGPDIEAELADMLAEAKSNKPAEGSGKDIFVRRVMPSRQDPASLCLVSYLAAFAENRLPEPGLTVAIEYPAVTVRISTDASRSDGLCSGKAVISTPETDQGARYSWRGILPQAGSFVGFTETEIEVVAEADGSISKRKGADLAHYLLGWLSLVLMRSVLAQERPAHLDTARQLILTSFPLEEAQTTQNLPQNWNRFASYIPLAAYSGALPEYAIPSVCDITRQHLCASEARQFASGLLEAAIIEDIKNRRDDAQITAGIARVKAIFGQMDWWRVQNALWADSGLNRAYPQTAAMLNFHI